MIPATEGHREDLLAISDDYATKVIFLHIPKAAGSTLHNILRRQYGKRETFHIDGGNVLKSVGEFQQLATAQRAEIKLLKGHMTFGLHDHFAEPVIYITMLRHPIDRIVSHYYYVLRTPSHYLHETLTSGKMSLLEYATSGISTELDNGQTRLLANDERTPFGQCSSGLLERARSNVKKHFRVVGLQERFNESLLLLQRELRWKWPIVYRQANVTASRPPLESLPCKVLEAIAHHNALDLELYAWIGQRFDQAIATRAGFRDAVVRFETLNRCYQKMVEPLLRCPCTPGKLNQLLS